MSDTSKIEWTDATWNPVLGCDHVSPGCDHCYAARLASSRLRHQPAFAGLAEGGRFNGTVRLMPERLGQPLRWRKPRRVFVNSMSDVFHKGVPEEFIAEAFAVMAAAHWHTFQLLTKRHGRMLSLLGDPAFRELVQAESTVLAQEGVSVLTNNPWEAWPLPNVWIGVSVEDQHWAQIRIPALLKAPAAVRWISAEPLLGPIDLKGAALRPYEREQGGFWEYRHGEDVYGNGKVWVPAPPAQLNWVVCGGESGLGARPMHPQWARSLRDQCAAAGVAFHFKQWGAYGPLPRTRRDGTLDHTDPGVTVANDGTVYQPGDLTYPDGPRYGEALRAGHDKAALTAMYRVGKKASGRELDGRTWDEYPDGHPDNHPDGSP